MKTRIRTYDKRRKVEGLREKPYLNISVSQSGLAGYTGRCEDVVENYPHDNPLTVDVYANRPSIMGGQLVDSRGKIIRRFTHVPMYYTTHAVAPDPAYLFEYPDFSAEIPNWIALMNPSVPAMLLPAFLGEFRDFPSMLTQIPNLIRAWGRRLLSGNPATRAAAGAALRSAFKDAGSAHLGVEFGWSPFLRDLANLLGFQKALQQRLLWLLQLFQGQSIKRRLQLPTQRIILDPGIITTQSADALVRQNQVQVFLARSWVTTRWVPLFGAMYRAMSFDEIYLRAHALTLGFSAWGLLLSWWELLPWSWFIDWFANVGRKLNIVANSLVLRLESCCYCRTSSVECFFTPTEKPSWLTISGSDYLYRRRKERRVLSTAGLLSPTPSLPAFTGRQLGILAALFAARS